MDDYIKSLLKDFFEEAMEMLETLEENVLILEKDYKNIEALQEIFRAVHTLKGSAASVEMFDLQKYSHNFEDLLDLIRNNRIEINRDTIDLLLHGTDTIRILVLSAKDNKKYKGSLDKDILLLEKFKDEKAIKEKKKRNTKKKEEKINISIIPKTKNASSENVNKNDPFFGIELDSSLKKIIIENKKKKMLSYFLNISFNTNNPMRSVGAIQVYVILREISSIISTNPSIETLQGDNFYENVVYLISTNKKLDFIKKSITLDDMTKNIEIKSFLLDEYEQALVDDKKNDANISDEYNDTLVDKKIEKHNILLRVESDKIDSMINQVGELVTNKSSYQRYDVAFNTFIKSLDEGLNELKKSYKNSVIHILRRFEALADKNEIKEIRDTYIDILNSNLTNISKNEYQFKDSLTKYRTSYQMLARITNDLQETVMKIRMVPISQIFNRFTRLVRDLSHELNKDVILKIYGEDTELDKSVIEILYDPILHLIRNSMDHGIEIPSEREKLGKNKIATLKLGASNEGNIIIIKVSDDGVGINTKKIFESAVKKGLIDKEAKLSEKEILDLIFVSGFSTANKISNISGRGVGMDVVKKSLEKINGSINIETALNAGTTFTLKIPLTLAILQTLIVEAEQEYYAIPINSIVETIRVQVTELEEIEGVTVIKVRDEIIAAISIKELFNLPNRNKNTSCHVVIVNSENKKIALIINSLVGEQDIVIKALNEKIIKSEGIAGATILGDGRVSFILDIPAVIDLSSKRIKEREKYKTPMTDKNTLKDFLDGVKELNNKKIDNSN